MLSPEKTKIVHLTEGFDFLGFNIRHYKAPLTSKSGYKLLIKPSKKSVKNIREKLKQKWLKLVGQDAQTSANQLNPVIRGGANYFRIGVASKTFHDLDEWMFHRELRYTRRTHPNKPWYWRKQKYWGKLTERGDNWVFGDKQTGANLMKFRWIKIERHVLVKGTASPDDPSLREYWIKRAEARAKDLTPREQKIAKNQNNIGPACKETLFNGEEVHVHHIKPKSQGGKDTYSNFIRVHLYCHQQVHSGKSAKPAIKELRKSDG